VKCLSLSHVFTSYLIRDVSDRPDGPFLTGFVLVLLLIPESIRGNPDAVRGTLVRSQEV
jgi:hypothetical protein